jgi:hypothetical protein
VYAQPSKQESVSRLAAFRVDAMKEIIERVLNYIPTYLLTFGRIFSSPKTFLAERELQSDTEWVEALIFFGVSVVLAGVTTAWATHKKGDLLTHISQEAILEVFGLAVAAISIQLAWRLVGERRTLGVFSYLPRTKARLC